MKMKFADFPPRTSSSTVDLHEYTSMDYEKSKVIIDEGRQATEDKERVLQAFRAERPGLEKLLEARNARRRQLHHVPQFVRVEGTDPDARKTHRRVSAAAGRQAARHQDSRSACSRASPASANSTPSATAKSRRAHAPVCWSPSTRKVTRRRLLQFAFEVDGSETADVTFTQAVRLTFMDVAGYRSEWRTDARFRKHLRNLQRALQTRSPPTANGSSRHTHQPATRNSRFISIPIRW